MLEKLEDPIYADREEEFLRWGEEFLILFWEG